MPGGGECWTYVTACVPSVTQPLVPKTAVSAPVQRQEGKKGPMAWPQGRGNSPAEDIPFLPPNPTALSRFTRVNHQKGFLAG